MPEVPVAADGTDSSEATTSVAACSVSKLAHSVPRVEVKGRRRKKGGLPSLIPLLRHIEGLDVSVELKNGRTYHGTLDSADAFMNLVLRNGKHVAKRYYSEHGGSACSATAEYELLHIRGPTIRYVHLPAGADVPRLIKAGQNRERTASDKYRRGTRKGPE